MPLSEFSLIERYFAPLGGNGRGVSLGIGDDCALLDIPEGQQLAVSIDTLVAGVHFPADTPAGAVAQRAAGACLSDLAAMGADPAWLTLALTLPEADPTWLQAFSRALADAIAPWQLCLVGGDTTRGQQLTVTLQVHGFVPRGQGLTRHGAQAGDRLFVSGTLGDSAAGLEQLRTRGDDAYLIERFYRPSPRIDTGIAIRPFASAAIDISDGLLADLGHILEQSRLGALIDGSTLPLSDSLKQQERQQALEWALNGGEDFELCFSVPPNRLADFEKALAGHSVPLTCIGELKAEPGLQIRDAEGRVRDLQPRGYQHF